LVPIRSRYPISSNRKPLRADVVRVPAPLRGGGGETLVLHRVDGVSARGTRSTLTDAIVTDAIVTDAIVTVAIVTDAIGIADVVRVPAPVRGGEQGL